MSATFAAADVTAAVDIFAATARAPCAATGELRVAPMTICGSYRRPLFLHRSASIPRSDTVATTAQAKATNCAFASWPYRG